MTSCSNHEIQCVNVTSTMKKRAEYLSMQHSKIDRPQIHRHDGNTIWKRLSVDIKTPESLTIVWIKLNKWEPRF